MGTRGPQPKPTALKKAAGNPGRRQLNENEPLPPPGEVLPPKFLKDKALEYWNEYAPIAIAMRTLTTADVMPFMRWCDKSARYELLRDMLATKSATTYSVKGQDGKIRYIQELPQSVELRKLEEQLLRLEREFGFTAASRSRIRVEPLRTITPAEAPLPTPTGKGTFDITKWMAGGGIPKTRPIKPA